MKKLLALYNTVFRFWMRFPEKIRFLLVGGYNTVFSYILYAVFLYISEGKYAQTALFGSFIVSSMNSYLTQKFYVFNTRGNYWREYTRCLGVWGVSYLVNALFLWILTAFLSMNPYGAQIIAIIAVTVLNYILLKGFAFRQRA